MRRTTVKNAIQTGIAAVVALGAMIGQAGALGPFGFANPTEPGFQVTKAQLGIISPANNVCPGNGTMTAWVFSNQPGSVDILIVRKGGAVAGPYKVTTVAGAGGIYMGSYTKALNIVSPVDAEY